jgi:putative ABC transport system permease protein
MRPPKLAKFLLKVLARRRDKAYLGDIEEIYLLRAERLGPVSANRWYRLEALRSLPQFIFESLRWRIVMFKNYLKTAVRFFSRDKGYSSLNMAGLAIGLACFAILMMWVQDEIGWDRFHENSRLIYRLESNSPAQPAPLGPYLKANYPEIAEAVRFYYCGPLLVRCGDKAFDEKGFVLGDPAVLDVFTIPFVAGSRTSALTDPNTVVLTEAAANKYFGNENPLGRVLTVENRFQIRVTGIVRNMPQNSDIQFDILGEFKILGYFRKGYETHWGNHEYFTYVRLAAGAEARTVIPKIARVIMDRDPGQPKPLTMTPLGRIHLYEDGAIRYVAIFALVAVFILAIASCNFINLTTARSGQRAKEIAVRKVAGADRRQLIYQFLSESVLLSLGAFLVALTSIALLLPSFDAVSGKDFGPEDLFKPGLFIFLLGTAVAVGVFSGAYPAFLLSSFRPASLLKGKGPRTGPSLGGARFRKTLVVTQFAISTVLMISTLLIHKQLVFVRDYDLGIRKENIVVLPAKEPIQESREAFVSRLTGRPGIINATFVSSPPSSVANYASGIEWEGMDAGLKPDWAFVATDDRYLDTLGLKIIAGRNFPENKSVKEVPYFIVNQKAVEEMKLKNPVGARFSLWGWNGTVLGVVNDFHFRPLREDLRPLLMFVLPEIYNQVLVKIRPENGNIPEVLAGIKDVWDEFAPGTPFSYEFLDTAYDRNYRAEQRMGKEFRYFSFLGIFISCLGLIGLAAYIAERKRKEIGIRKVLGATLPDILQQVNKEFLGPILLSNLVAWPAAYWAMKTWLQGFAFRTNISLGIFFVSAVSTLAVGLFTVSFQSFKAARENPARSLKCE